MFSLLPHELAWRILFLIGILPALFVIFIRRFVDEPELFVAQQRKQIKSAESSSFTEIFAPGMITTTLRAVLLTTGAQGGYYAINTWLPTFLKTERHLTVLATGGYLAMAIFGSYVGYIVSAFLTDYLGRKKNFILFALGSLCTALLYMFLPITDTAMLFLGFPLGFFISGVFSGMGAFLTELYPTRIRGSGQGFCYNMGRAIGALFPFLIGVASKDVPLGESIGMFAAIAYGLMILAAISLPETRGKQLEA
jgi:MFS family permease